MRYGVTLQGREDPATFAETAAWIESLGYEQLWITDSSLHAGDVYVYATVALQSTERLVVGTAVTNPLTRHPGVTANALRSLHELAPGRVVCGIGVGDRPLHELGLPFAKLATLADTIAVLRRLWRGETIDGRVGPHRFESARLPTAVPEIPLYVAASGPRALELAGEHGDGAIVLAGLFPEALAYTRERIAAGRSRSRRDAFEVVAFLYGAIDEYEDAALEAGRSIAAWFPQTAPAHARLAGMSDELIDRVAAAYAGGEFQEAAAAARLIPDELVQKLAFVGTPATAAQKLDSLHGEGLDAVSIFPLGDSRRETIAAFAGLAFART